MVVESGWDSGSLPLLVVSPMFGEERQKKKRAHDLGREANLSDKSSLPSLSAQSHVSMVLQLLEEA